jgi:cysteine desulfurase
MPTPARIYADFNATAPVHPAAREAMLRALERTGNPSAVHAEGRAARDLVEAGRASVARAFGVAPVRVNFTSGASEAAATLLRPDWMIGGDPRAVTAVAIQASAHPCLQAGGGFAPAARHPVAVDRQGQIDLESLSATLSRIERPLLAVEAANGETGVEQPLDRIAEIARAHLSLIVCDAVQAFGRRPAGEFLQAADAVFVSSHKIGGPAGIGAIVVASDAVAPPVLIAGGGQERGRRAGTVPVALVAGFAAAVDAVTQGVDAEAARIAVLRNRLQAALLDLLPGARVAGDKAPRLPNTLCLLVPGLSAETAVIALDLAGLAVSSGSACASGKVGRSHVLAAMGISSEFARGALRFSLGPSTVADDVDRIIAVCEQVLPAVARRSRAVASDERPYIPEAVGP